MLHTNQWNKSLSKHKKMNLEGFVRMVRSVKDAENIKVSLLELLYDSMTKYEMKLCDGSRNNDISWKLLLKRSRAINTEQVVHSNESHKGLLDIVFNPLLTSFSVIFDVLRQKEQNENIITFNIHISNDELVHILLSGYFNLSRFIFHELDRDKMDALIAKLCQLISCNQSALIFSKCYCLKELTHLLFDILFKYAAKNCVSEKGWKCILEIIFYFARFELLPSKLLILDDFVGQIPSERSFKYLAEIDAYRIQKEKIHQNKLKNEQSEQTLFGTIAKFIDLFTTDDDLHSLHRKQKEKQIKESTQIILSEYCKISILIKSTSTFNIEAVRYLISALINKSNFGIINRKRIQIKEYGDEYRICLDDEGFPLLQQSCLSLQFLVSILLHNWRRIDYIWDEIVSHLKLLLDINGDIFELL